MFQRYNPYDSNLRVRFQQGLANVGKRSLNLMNQNKRLMLEQIKKTLKLGEINASGDMPTVHVYCKNCEGKNEKTTETKITYIEEKYSVVTLDDLIKRAKELAAINEEAGKMFTSIIYSTVYPGSLTQDNNMGIKNLSETDMSFLIKFPTIVYFSEIKSLINKVVAAAYAPINSTIPIDKKWIVELAPACWFHTLMRSLEPSVNINPDLPDQTTLNKTMFKNDILEVSARNRYMYAADLPYHMTRVAAFMSTVPFFPTSKAQEVINSAVYTDIQLLVHFAMMLADPETYENFAQDEARYLLREHQVTENVMKAIELLYKVQSAQSNVIKGGQNAVVIGGTVPREIATVLMNFLIDVYEIYIKNITLTRTEWNIYRDTPIGRLLNFDSRAMAEITKYVKLRVEKCGLYVNDMLRLRSEIDTVSQLDCFRRVYASILTAAMVIYVGAGGELNDRTPLEDVQPSMPRLRQNISLIMERVYSVSVIESETFILNGYSSSLELFPGVFYGSLMMLPGKYHGDKDYYIQEPARKLFMDMFAKYSLTLSRIDESDLIKELPSHRMVCKSPDELLACKRESTHATAGLRFKNIAQTITFMESNRQQINTIWAAFLRLIRGTDVVVSHIKDMILTVPYNNYNNNKNASHWTLVPFPLGSNILSYPVSMFVQITELDTHHNEKHTNYNGYISDSVSTFPAMQQRNDLRGIINAAMQGNLADGRK